MKLFLFLFVFIFSTPLKANAEEIRIAVASNFSKTMISLAHQYEQNTNNKVTLMFGSSGKHFAQIIHGAPFDAFFSADTKRPLLLEKKGLSIADSRFTYAIGKLVLWSPTPNYIDVQAKILTHGNFHHLAIANPKLAPYGKAAKEMLLAKGLWQKLQKRFVRGENISQTFQFVKSGNAELGLVAYSQIKQADTPILGSFWKVPESFYTPIKQQVILLKNNKTAINFLNFIQSKEAKTIIHAHGYTTKRQVN